MSYFKLPAGFSTIQEYCDKVLLKADAEAIRAFDETYAAAARTPGYLTTPLELAGSTRLCTPGCQVRRQIRRKRR